MKIIALSDIHGRTGYDKKTIDILSGADLIIIAGDITNFGGKNDAGVVLDEIMELNQNVLAIPGNCDRPDVIDLLKAKGVNLHGEIREFRDILFFGVGGSGLTPFNTPQEYSDDEFEAILNRYKKDKYLNIFVSHSPPYKTKVDKTLMGIHAGSKKVREFIERYQPQICICGHIHEARNIDQIGKTTIVNPGIFPKFCALIEIVKEIRVELIE
ncbi:MAG: metallophosphoesterase [bacterium]